MKGNNTAVVTGGAGFIGSHIVDQLIKSGIETYVIDNLSTGSMENLSQHRNNDLLHVMTGDIKDIDTLLSEVGRIDTVFHEAAIANVPLSISKPLLVYNVNVHSTMKVLNFCVKKKVRRFVFASSAAVYGEVKESPAVESLPCAPISPYGASKMAVEDYLSAYNNSYGLKTVALRYFNVFGPRQKKSDYSGVITIFINKLLNGDIPTIFGDGSQTRDFVHVRDIVQANMLAMASDSAIGQVFNVASGSLVSILELFEMIRNATHTEDVVPEFAPSRPGDSKGTSASIEKIKEKLGYNPRIKLDEGLSELVDYMKNASQEFSASVESGIAAV